MHPSGVITNPQIVIPVGIDVKLPRGSSTDILKCYNKPPMDQPRLIPDEPDREDIEELDELQGTVERITYRNDENGYTVARFHVDSAGIHTITGRFPSINEGEHLTVSGRWVDHPKFGRQFDAKHSRMSAPATLKGMEKYLSSGLVEGIGPHFAKRIVKHFGAEVFDVIEETPERLREVPGIGSKRAGNLAEAFRKQKAIRNLMVFLQDHDVSATIAVKVYKEYGDESLRVLKDNPYMLADDIFGIGFKTADGVARKLGMTKDDARRHRAGVRYILKQASDEGHVYVPREQLLINGEELLEADVNSIDEAIKFLSTTGDVVDDHGRIYLDFLHKAEGTIADVLSKLASGRVRNYQREALLAKINKIQQVERLDLARQQLQAVVKSFEKQCLVITGGPGTGKSTTVRVIVRLFEQLGRTVRLASPTGRAAKRLEEACGRPASTIHRLLEYHPRQGFGRNADVPLDCKVLVVDEASMLDVPLMYYLLRALPGKCRLILVGDVDQLPSVGPGCVLRDAIDSGVVPVVELTEIFRQAAGSLIVTNAHRINSGQGPTFDPKEGDRDFRMVPEENKELIGDRVIEVISTKLLKRFDPLTEIQVLTPMHAGSAGARELNRRLQETCNPPSDDKTELRIGDRIFRTHDRVMQIRNNYELDVFNGDIGSIVAIDNRDGAVTVEFDRMVRYRKTDLDELQLAYAITVHKSQGSEYPCVVIPMTTAHYIMLQRNLLYTAVTRAKNYCVVVGQRKAVWRAIRNARTGERFTNLRVRLMDAAEKIPEREPSASQ